MKGHPQEPPGKVKVVPFVPRPKPLRPLLKFEAILVQRLKGLQVKCLDESAPPGRFHGSDHHYAYQVFSHASLKFLPQQGTKFAMLAQNADDPGTGRKSSTLLF
jgi:hypothetical protein